ncbi:MAG TPA: PDDEXK nuclease domain-containing protein [Armatimonadota bacterium]|nr:PDDEXK nuclease domain-containing protein [Armatimonadota bacterium]
MSSESIPPQTQLTTPEAVSANLLADVRSLIDDTRTRLAQTVNSELALLYWKIGDRINRDVLGNDRADYGERVIDNLAATFTAEYGRGFNRRSLYRMVRFAHIFPNPEIVSALGTQLSWTHWRELIAIDDDLKRDFYTQMCRVERWSVRTLRQKIQGMLFERTALSKKPEELIRQELNVLTTHDQLTPDLVFHDPYFLDFLGLADTYSEHDLEAAIIRDIERFLLELGVGFTFAARQKRISTEKKDHYLDLLLYHRGLRRLVAIDLKLGPFEPAHKGQMELYLRWLDKYDRQEGEESPIGLILCSEKDREDIELLQLDAGEIRISEYLTALPPRSLLEQKLRQAVMNARATAAQLPATEENDTEEQT